METQRENSKFYERTNIGQSIVYALDLVWLIALALIFLAPYFASKGNTKVAGIIYMIFKPLCHQHSSRSFFVWGHQMSVCARCLGIYIGLKLASVFAIALLLVKKLKPLPIYAMIIFLIPVAIDGTIQLLGLRESTNIIRLLTGLLAGIGIILFLYPRIWRMNKFNTLGQETEEVKGG